MTVIISKKRILDTFYEAEKECPQEVHRLAHVAKQLGIEQEIVTQTIFESFEEASA